MIEMAMSEDHRVNLTIRRNRRAIERLGFPAALKEAAIHKDARALRLHAVTRAGNFAARGADGSNLPVGRWSNRFMRAMMRSGSPAIKSALSTREYQTLVLFNSFLQPGTLNTCSVSETTLTTR